MVKPREIVLRLKGGGDCTPLGGVDFPAVTVVVVPPSRGGSGPAADRGAAGDDFGRQDDAEAYSDRFKP